MAEEQTPVERVATAQATVTAAVVALEGAAGQWAALQTVDVAGLFGVLMRLRAWAEGTAVAVLQEAQERGLIATSEHQREVDWIRAMCERAGTTVTTSVATQFRQVATQASLSEPDMTPLRTAVTVGAVPVALAARMRNDLDLITSRVPAPVAATAVHALIDYAAGGASGRELTATRDAIIANYGDEGTFEERQTFAHQHREMTTWSRDGYDRHVCMLAVDNAGRAIVDAALSALAAPLPRRDDAGRVVEADPRTAGQRRADAVIEMCRVVATRPPGGTVAAPAEAVGRDGSTAVDVTGAASDGWVPGRPARIGGGLGAGGDEWLGGAKGQLMLTMPLADLQAKLGYALDEHGQPLPPSVMRRLCCDADLIPAVLGTRGEVVDLGYTARTASRGQRRVLAQRDRGCSFPGCDRPASWCDAHHLIHWVDGGRTNVDNLALLCTYHHTHVHQSGYVGRLGPDGRVRWLRAHRAEPVRATAGEQTSGAQASIGQATNGQASIGQATNGQARIGGATSRKTDDPATSAWLHSDPSPVVSAGSDVAAMVSAGSDVAAMVSAGSDVAAMVSDGSDVAARVSARSDP